MSTPKHLRKISDGRVFAYTDVLAKRSDMVALWEEGEEPEIELGTGGGLEIDPSDFDRKTKKLLEQKDKMIVSLEREMDKLVAENQQLLDSVADLEEQLGIDPAEKEEEKPAPVDLSPEDRMKLLVESVEEMIEDDDPLNFTSAGMPRVERLEDFSGLSDVSAEERNEAYRIVKAE